MRDLLWNISQEKYNQSENRKYETLFTLANGYRGFRGTLEYTKIGERGNFIAGIFDKSTAIATEIVNCQDPLCINFYIEDELVNMEMCEVLSFNRTLNMKEGILYTQIGVKTKKGKILKINSERFVSRNNVHRWGVKYTIIPVNFTGFVFIENIIDGTVLNSIIKPENTTKHIDVRDIYDLKPGIAMRTATIDKGIQIIEGTLIMADSESVNFLKDRKFSRFGERARELYEILANEGEEYTVYKYGVTYTSRDSEKDTYELCCSELNAFLRDGFEWEKIEHKHKWLEIWKNIDIEIDGDDEAQTGIRFNLFHMASSAYEGDERVSIAAKALHGEGYKGHVFWDTETFMLPFFIYTQPHVAKQLLMYRYNNLDGARANARLNGFKGARFPWESADDGREVTPAWGYDFDGSRIKIWTGEEEYHINSDITYAVWQYYRATGDKQFLFNCALEIFLDTSKFWQSRVEYNTKKDRYEINKVIGPDEFHEHINNNSYTNYLAKWSIKKSLELINWIKQEDRVHFDKLCNKLGLNEDDFTAWNIIQEKIYIPRDKNSRLIEQFEGYFKLEDIAITQYDENGMPIWPELGKYTLGDTQLVKQADIVMLMLLLNEEFDDATKVENYRYYEKRTMHKSSLSPSMYSILGLSVGDNHNSYKYFMKTIMTDLKDNQGNTDAGIHAAAVGGCWQSAIFGFGGFKIDKDDIPHFKPWIPENWNAMKFNIKWKNSTIYVTITQKQLEISSSEDLTFRAYNKEFVVEQGKCVTIYR